MKKEYVKPTSTIDEFESADILTASEIEEGNGGLE